MIKPIKTEKQYQQALKTIYSLLQQNLKPNSERANELEVLSILVKNHEEKNYPMPKPHPIEAIKFRLEQMGEDEKMLNKILGTRSRKSEILSGKRKLNLDMIRKINSLLHIPAEVLIKAY